MIKRLVFLFIVLSALCNTMTAQTVRSKLPYEHIGESDGLSSKTIYTMIQDADGFMWFGTDAGVFRYDGKTFNHYTVKDGLSDNEVLKIKQDSKGRIWFLTFNGRLSYWYKGKFYNENNLSYLKGIGLGGSATMLYEDLKGRIWINYWHLGIITIDDTVVTSMKIPVKERGYGGAYVFEDAEKNLWYKTVDGYVNLATHDTVIHNYLFWSYTANEKEFISYFIADGVFSFDGKKIKKITGNEYFPNFTSIVNFQKVGSYLWMCTLGKGVFRIDESGVVTRYLENSSVTSVVEDKEGILWFSTMDDGVYFLTKDTRLVRNYTKESGLSAKRAFSVTRSDDNSICLGYDNGTVDFILNGKKKNYDLKGPLDPSFLRVTNLFWRKDTLWCGNDIAIHYITHNKVYWVPYLVEHAVFQQYEQEVTRYSVKDLYIDDKNDMYLTYNFGVAKLVNLEKGVYVKGLLDSIVRSFATVKLDNGNFLISTLYGLREFSPGKLFRPFLKDSILNNVRAVDIAFDSDGYLIVATYENGVFIFKDKTLVQHLTMSDGLSSENCRRICLQDMRMVLATGGGATMLEKQNGKWMPVKIITMQDGILSNSVNDIYLQNDSVYLATDNGLSVLSYSGVHESVYNSKVIITHVEADSIQNSFDSTFSFLSDIRRLTISFSYPVFDPANKVSLVYRLVRRGESDVKWISTINNEVEYSSLPPGNYTFEVKPKGVDTAATVIGIIILPKWWQTVTAKVVYVIISGLLLFIIIRYRLRKQFERKLFEMKQASLIESERNRIASDMHDDIGGDLTQISLWMNILRKYEMKDNEIIQKVTMLSDDVLSKMNQIIWALDSMHNNSTDLFSFIRYFVAEILSPTGIKLEYKIEEDFPELSVSAFQRRNIFLVIKELVNNSIKYSEAAIIDIKIRMEGKVLCIDYSDNGKGFDVNKEYEGYGLYTISRRITEIGGEIRLESKIAAGFFGYIRIVV